MLGCSPWDCYELDTTERLHFHFSLSCIRGGNGNPLQYPCLENPRDGGAWWAAVYGVRHDWSDLAAAEAIPQMNTCKTQLSNCVCNHLPVGKGLTISSVGWEELWFVALTDFHSVKYSHHGWFQANNVRSLKPSKQQPSHVSIDIYV